MDLWMYEGDKLDLWDEDSNLVQSLAMTGAGLVQTVTGRLKMPGNTGVWWYMPTPLVREMS